MQFEWSVVWNYQSSWDNLAVSSGTKLAAEQLSFLTLVPQLSLWRLLFSANAAWYVSVWTAKSHSISFCCSVALQNHFWFSAYCLQNVSFDITVFIFFFLSVYLSCAELHFPHMNFNILLSQFSSAWISVGDLSVFIAVSFLSKENYYCFDKLFHSTQLKK